ncbi:hypothetical protein LCGC14_3011710, partial [marine sediment metagenome]
LLRQIGWKGLLIVFGLPGLIVGYFFLRERFSKAASSLKSSRADHSSSKASIPVAFFAVFLIGIMLRVIGTFGLLSFIPAYLVNALGLHPDRAALLAGLGFAGGLICAPITGRTADKIGPLPVLLVVTGALVPIIFLFGLSTTRWLVPFFINYFIGALGGKGQGKTTWAREQFLRSRRALAFDITAEYEKCLIVADSLELVLGIEGKEIARIKNKSLKDEMKIMAEAPNGIIIAEAAQITFSAFRKLQARVARTRGWIFAEGTFEGSTGWYPELWQHYQTPGTDGVSFSLPSWTNLSFYPKGREDPEILRQESLHSKDFFLERFAAIPAKPEGIIISEFQNRIHVGDYPFNPDLPVEISNDPG